MGCNGLGLGGGQEALLGESCNVPADQKGSFMGQVPAFPILITVDSAFTSEQRKQIAWVVAQWNSEGQRAIHKNIFRLQYGELRSSDRTLNPSDCSQDFGSESAFSIVRESSESHWTSLGFTRSIPGATFRCEQGGYLIRQIVYLYPEMIDPAQLGSVTLHELGHAMGLDHSCMASGSRADFLSCTGLEATHSYRQAAMYPWLRTRSGGVGSLEIKDVLRSNDELRGRCAMGVNS